MSGHNSEDGLLRQAHIRDGAKSARTSGPRPRTTRA